MFGGGTVHKVLVAAAVAALSLGTVACKTSVAPVVAACSIDATSSLVCNVDNLVTVGPVAVPAEIASIVALLDPGATFSCTLNVQAKTGVCTDPLTGLPSKTFKL